MLLFRRVFRVIQEPSRTPIMGDIIAVQEYLAPGLDEGQYAGQPKTQIDFTNGTQIVILGDALEIDRKLKEKEKEISMGIDGKEFI